MTGRPYGTSRVPPASTRPRPPLLRHQTTALPRGRGAPVDPADLVTRAAGGGRAEMPERLVRTFLSVWDDPVSGTAAVALLRSSLHDEWTARLLKEFLTTQVLRRALAPLELPRSEAPLRSALVCPRCSVWPSAGTSSPRTAGHRARRHARRRPGPHHPALPDRASDRRRRRCAHVPGAVVVGGRRGHLAVGPGVFTPRDQLARVTRSLWRRRRYRFQHPFNSGPGTGLKK